MASNSTILLCGADGRNRLWSATTLDQLGKMEAFLEDVLAAQPELLGLESLRTGIRPPWKVFRRIILRTPTTRDIEADVMLFCASGHVVIVEVKRSVNPELRDRQVISQLLDYATSVQTLTEADLLETFRERGDGAADWPSLVASWFPSESDPEDLAIHYLRRLERGEVHLVIACDRAPPGVAALVEALSRQAATGFELDLVEVVPYVASSDSGEILFVPRPRVTTRIVARTAVTVEYRSTEGRPATKVTTTPIEEIEEQVRTAERAGVDAYRDWTLEEIDAEVAAANSPVMTRLLSFCKTHSFGGRILAEGKKVNPTFGFNIPARRDGGPVTRITIFNCNARGDAIYFYFNFVERAVGATLRQEFVTQLTSVFGSAIRADRPEQYLQLDLIGPKQSEFESQVLWLKSQAAARCELPA